MEPRSVSKKDLKKWDEGDLGLSFEGVEEHRKIDCVFYSLCLDNAYTFRYPSFSCKDCENFIPDSKEEIYEQNKKTTGLSNLILNKKENSNGTDE